MELRAEVNARTVYQMVYESEEVVAMMTGYICHTICMAVDQEKVFNVEKFITVPRSDGLPDELWAIGTYQPHDIPAGMPVSGSDMVYIISMVLDDDLPVPGRSDNAHLN